MPTTTAYSMECPYEGTVHIIDNEDGERAARVSRFTVGADLFMVSVDGPNLTPPALARAIAEAMVMVADEIEPPA